MKSRERSSAGAEGIHDDSTLAQTSLITKAILHKSVSLVNRSILFRYGCLGFPSCHVSDDEATGAVEELLNIQEYTFIKVESSPRSNAGKTIGLEVYEEKYI